MVVKNYNLNGKYKKLVHFDIVAIVLFTIISILMLALTISIWGDEELLETVPIVLVVLMIFPISFALGGYQYKKQRELDVWILDNDNNLYYVEVNDKEYLRHRDKLKDKDFLSPLLQTSTQVYNLPIYKIIKVKDLEEKNNYLRIKVLCSEMYTNKNKEKVLYIMKNTVDYNELLNNIKNI